MVGGVQENLRPYRRLHGWVSHGRGEKVTDEETGQVGPLAPKKGLLSQRLWGASEGSRVVVTDPPCHRLSHKERKPGLPGGLG